MSEAGPWWAAVELGARGRYDAAQGVLEDLTRGEWRSLALSTMASHRRQIGATAEATRLDEDALACATDAQSRADALIGLAADAVAVGDGPTAVRRHGEAQSDASRRVRTRTRWHWVGAELALLTDDRCAAREHAEAALAASRGESVRHEMKSRVVLAAVSGCVDELEAVSLTLDAQDWRTLEWPLALVVADHAGHNEEAWSARAWQRGIEATHVIEAHVPAGLVETWRVHPGVTRLRAGGPWGGAG